MLRELTHSEIEDVLRNNYIGRIGCQEGDRIYIVPVNYLFDLGNVYCQSYEGQKVEMMRDNPDICFEVEEIHSFNHWKTVVGWGIFEELTDPREIERVRSQLSEMMLAQKAMMSGPPPEKSVERPRTDLQAQPVYYRIRFAEWSGRMENGFR